MPLLLRRPVHPGLPDAHRRAQIHPPDPPSRRDRRGPDDPGGQRLRRELRPGLPDRGPLRGGLRRPHPDEGAGADRPAPAARLRRRRGPGRRFFEAGPPTGRRVAVIGSGPAGLSCAHGLRRLGHEVVVFEARDVPGGLDTLGIAAYKISTEFALSEIAMIREIGIDLRLDHRVTADEVPDLLGEYDAVFLGVGLGRTAPLGIEGEDLRGRLGGARLHLPDPRAAVRGVRGRPPRPGHRRGQHGDRRGHGRPRLGAERVTIAYRRGEAAMPAFAYEYGLAKADGVRFEWHAPPLRVVGRDGAGRRASSSRRTEPSTRVATGDLRPIPGSRFVIEADMVVKALGQEPLLDLLGALPGLAHDRGRVAVDPATGATSIPRLFAGGDCLRNGGEVVDAVQDGKVAARGIDRLDLLNDPAVHQRGPAVPDLSVDFCGVKAPNPFWLASAPPTNSEYQVRRAFDAGWGGAVWKTLAREPIVNVSSRYGAVDYDGRKVMGLNNIELITDRPLDGQPRRRSPGSRRPIPGTRCSSR